MPFLHIVQSRLRVEGMRCARTEKGGRLLSVEVPVSGGREMERERASKSRSVSRSSPVPV
jgi:hypothetical protein